MKCSCSLRFSFPSALEAQEALDSIGAGGPKRERFSVGLAVKGRALVVEISATDSVALRAAVNSCLRNIKIIENISGVVK